jgi:protoheme IX farnesyltransferase
MFIGERGVPPAGKFAAAMIGLALACGGASALNHLLDRDIDQEMKRTAGRPVASGRVAAPRALEFGLALSAASFVLLSALVNPLTAAVALAGNLFYVIVYTRWLKRSTVQNIVIGGAAGAVPPLVGWAAATGRLSVGALVLFVIVFVWTPPHFWALAMLIKRDYASAGVPMLPVVRGDEAAARQILVYSVGLVVVTALPVLAGIAGALYLAVAAAAGAWFVWLAWRLERDPAPRRAGALFHYSMVYLAVLFVAMAAGAV